jgi:hypothetical protein
LPSRVPHAPLWRRRCVRCTQMIWPMQRAWRNSRRSRLTGPRAAGAD